jgi:hypothetical protein
MALEHAKMNWRVYKKPIEYWNLQMPGESSNQFYVIGGKRFNVKSKGGRGAPSYGAKSKGGPTYGGPRFGAGTTAKHSTRVATAGAGGTMWNATGGPGGHGAAQAATMPSTQTAGAGGGGMAW